MLKTAYDEGYQAALARYGVKEAGVFDWLKRVGTEWGAQATDIATRRTGRAVFQPGGALHELKSSLVGSPTAVLEGKKLFQPGGMLHHSNVFWPTTGHPVSKWGQRIFGTILPAYGVYKTMTGEYGDPNEGRLTNVLGAVGGALGSAYGYPLFGMLGGGLASDLGRGLGKSVGRMLGSSPSPPPQAPQEPYYYPQASYPPQGYPYYQGG